MSWALEQGKFNHERWRKGWEDLCTTHELVHNRRKTLRTAVSEEGDGAFAVVDVDTLWRDAQGEDFHWLGRACKTYSLCEGAWKMTAHTGLLDYSAPAKSP